MGDPQSWNGYSYVENMPTAYTDPSGQFLEGTGIGAAAGGPVGAAIGAAVDVGLAFLGDWLFGGGGSQPASTPLSPEFQQPGNMYSPDTTPSGSGPDSFSFQQVTLTPPGAVPSVNIQLFVAQILRTCLAASHGECSAHVYAALQKAYGGQIRTPRPSGGKFGKVMTEVGCAQISTPPVDYNASLGDVMVIQPTTQNPSGHVQVWTGKHWTSDFDQVGRSAPWPGPAYAKEKPPYAVYRCSK
jgi:hypothetical protein